MTDFDRVIDIVVEPHDGVPDGCDARFQAKDAPREVRRVRVYRDRDGELCEVVGVSSDGREIPARAATVDDSGEGEAVIVWGGDHGLRLTPEKGAPFFEAFLRISKEDVVG